MAMNRANPLTRNEITNLIQSQQESEDDPSHR
jgi:hypothetical protein